MIPVSRAIPCFVLLLCLTHPAIPARAGEQFGPWGADVLVGDGNLPAPGAASVKGRGVYNGFQGGAYFLLRFFQVVISPQDGPSCRYHPVCSAYARAAVEKYGALLGSILAGDRLLRCNPYAPRGDDPVPRTLGGE